MSHRDIVDYNQVSVKFVEDEESIKSLTNPMYRPILLMLREGVKTAEEIEEEFKTKEEYREVSGKTPSLKTIYRHLKALTNAELVIQAGVRILDRTGEDKPPVTQKLFGRTAKFFYLSDKSKKVMEAKKLERRAEILTKLLKLTHKVDKVSVTKIKKLLSKFYTFELEESERLFKQYPEELAEIAGDLPLNDLQYVLEDYLVMKLLGNTDILNELKEIF
jgi:hypothetical protein